MREENIQLGHDQSPIWDWLIPFFLYVHNSRKNQFKQSIITRKCTFSFGVFTNHTVEAFNWIRRVIPIAIINAVV
jgi:hypothetical protein